MLPIYADLALRSSDVLGDFVDSFPLQHVYGDLSGSKIRCGKLSSTVYFVADHPMADVSGVQISGQDTSAWKWYVKTDRFNVTSTYIELGSPPSLEGAVVTASGKGKLNQKDGKLLDNPADVIKDIAFINGRVIDFPLFREECNRRGLKVGGVLDEVKSMRLHVKQLLESLNALWVKDNAIFLDSPIGYAEKITSYTSPIFSTSSAEHAGSVKLGYNYNHGAGRYGSFVTVAAKGSPFTNERQVFFKWLRSNRTAIEEAEFLATYLAGQFVSVDTTVAGIKKSGDAVYLENAFFPQPFIITEAVPSGVDTRVKGIITLALWGSTKLSNYTAEAPITQREAIELSFEGGVLTITIYDIDNRPFIGAYVSLDKSAPKKTNARGKVQFRTTSGGHVLDIAAPGFQSITNLPINVQ